MTQKQTLSKSETDAASAAPSQPPQGAQQQVQTTASDETKAVQSTVQFHFPKWPTSVRGPLSTPAPVGMQPINAMRREQVAEIGYNQEAGEPGVTRTPDDTAAGPATADQLPTTAQKVLGRRKERL